MRADFLQNFGALIDRVKFARDSPLEGVGFESSVPHEKQPFLAAPVRSPQFAFGNKNRLFRARDRWFESISLQRRVYCEPGSAGPGAMASAAATLAPGRPSRLVGDSLLILRV